MEYVYQIENKMEQIVVKSEVQSNGEILLYTLYVDDNGEENNENQVLELQENDDYEIIETKNPVENVEYTEQPIQSLPEEESKDKWLEEDVTRLLVFYIDNKEAFISGTTKKQHLWTVACKTMLIGKSPHTCEVKLRNLKKKYANLRLEQLKGVNVSWPLYELCHQAFHDDSYTKLVLNEHIQQAQSVVKLPIQPKVEENTGVVVVKNVNAYKSGTDHKVEAMLNLYLRYKNNFQKDTNRKSLWEAIARELGEENSDYWHKRFLNFKQHYLRMLAKRSTDSMASINWPYMDMFDRIFEDDPVFQKKYADQPENATDEKMVIDTNEWNHAECTILVKYYFDCFDEFQDSTVPNSFLWAEVGRLLDKKPEICIDKFNELKSAHLDYYLEGGYDLRTRQPLAILFDNIISKEIDIELFKDGSKLSDVWLMEQIDDLVKFFYENIEMFKDPICYNVCWAGISKKLRKSVRSCKKQWDDLKVLYKSILDDKMENPDLQIDWRYIELFDRIFDYGMDTNLLNSFDKPKDVENLKVAAKKVTINLDNETYENGTDEEDFDEKGSKRSRRGVGESKAFKILEYYQKNKEKFSTTQRKKQVLWDVLAKQIGITGEQCAHRFRNLKQVYMAYVQREINKPEMPILWPYYALCKKVFGYRAIKSKLKTNKVESDETEEWTAKEIKLLINYFGSHFDEFCDSDDPSKWSDLAQELGKTNQSVYEKFNELRKSYKRLKTMKEQNPNCKVSWKYYGLFEDIYSRSTGMENDDVEIEYETIYEEEPVEDRNESQDEEDYECIIVIPEGEDLSDISNAQIIIQEAPQNPQDEEMQEVVTTTPTITKWTKRIKKKLLIFYLNYIRSKKGKEIVAAEMWKEIASKLPEKTPVSCRKMFARLKANHLKLKDEDPNDPNKKKTPYYTLVEKILAIKPKFAKTAKKELKDGKPYKDVVLPAEKVEQALQYYLQHIEEFASPKFEKKYVWTELAKAISEPVNKLFNKINYLKHINNAETNEVAVEISPYSELLKAIAEKENKVKASIGSKPVILEENEVDWSDEETENLLVWYLANLDKFKNPKFVRKYLWMEATSILQKSPLNCSKKMAEIRTQYKAMIKENPEELNSWRFYELCQKIYGTGKKSDNVNNLISFAQIVEEHNV